MKYACPCCGHKTLDNKPPGTFDICPICFWEDDDAQFDDPDYVGGANTVSLRVARQNFIDFGVSERRFQKTVRPPKGQDEKDVV